MYRFLVLAVLAAGCQTDKQQECDDANAAFSKYLSAYGSCAADSDCVITPSCGLANRAADANTCAQLSSQATQSCATVRPPPMHFGGPACTAACDVDAGDAGLCTCRPPPH